MITKHIELDLDPEEQQQWIDALNWYKEDPSRPPQRWVLAQKSKARIVAIGKQFGIDVYPGTPPVPPDPPPPGDLCAACLGLVHPLDVEWGDIRPIKTAQLSPRFGCNDYWVLKFTVPAIFPNDGYTSVAGFDGPENFRQITLSRSQCDFREPDPSGVNGPFSRGDGTSATVTLPAGSSPSALVPGATYFINIRNWSRDLSSPGCNPDQLTDAIIQFHWPK